MLIQKTLFGRFAKTPGTYVPTYHNREMMIVSSHMPPLQPNIALPYRLRSQASQYLIYMLTAMSVGYFMKKPIFAVRLEKRIIYIYERNFSSSYFYITFYDICKICKEENDN